MKNNIFNALVVVVAISLMPCAIATSKGKEQDGTRTFQQYLDSLSPKNRKKLLNRMTSRGAFPSVAKPADILQYLSNRKGLNFCLDKLNEPLSKTSRIALLKLMNRAEAPRYCRDRAGALLYRDSKKQAREYLLHAARANRNQKAASILGMNDDENSIKAVRGFISKSVQTSRPIIFSAAIDGGETLQDELVEQFMDKPRGDLALALAAVDNQAIIDPLKNAFASSKEHTNDKLWYAAALSRFENEDAIKYMEKALELDNPPYSMWFSDVVQAMGYTQLKEFKPALFEELRSIDAGKAMLPYGQPKDEMVFEILRALVRIDAEDKRVSKAFRRGLDKHNASGFDRSLFGLLLFYGSSAVDEQLRPEMLKHARKVVNLPYAPDEWLPASSRKWVSGISPMDRLLKHASSTDLPEDEAARDRNGGGRNKDGR